jgi:hypothetical protein
MTYAWIQDVPIGENVYRQIKARIIDQPFDGLMLHMALRKPDGKLRYVEAWESRESRDKAFAELVHPAVFGVFRELPSTLAVSRNGTNSMSSTSSDHGAKPSRRDNALASLGCHGS